MPKKPLRLCLACSSGGHLTEMTQLQPLYEKFDRFFITFDRPDTQDLASREKVFFVERPARNPVKTIQSFAQSFNIVFNEQPDVVISTGADVAIPACIAAKLLGKKVVFIESYCRPIVPGWSGRIAYYFADLFLYQWKALERYYPKGKFAGSIF